MEVTNEYIMRRLGNLTLVDETLQPFSTVGSLTLYVNDRILLSQGYTEYGLFVIGKQQLVLFWRQEFLYSSDAFFPFLS